MAEDRARGARHQGNLKKKTKEQISTLTWLETYTNRDKKGRVPERAKGFPSHHIGCLWAHLYDWQMSADAGYPATVVFESDHDGPRFSAWS